MRTGVRGSRDESSPAVAWSWPCRAGRARSSGITRSTESPRTFRVRAFDHGINYVSQPKRPFVAVVDGSKWIGLDPATGRLRGPAIDLGFTPVRPIQYADLDGDGATEVLALERGKAPGPSP